MALEPWVKPTRATTYPWSLKLRVTPRLPATALSTWIVSTVLPSIVGPSTRTDAPEARMDVPMTRPDGGGHALWEAKLDPHWVADREKSP